MAKVPNTRPFEASIVVDQHAFRPCVNAAARHPNLSEAAGAQLAAMAAWAKSGDESYAYLKKIMQPVLVTNGNNDTMIPTVNSITLSEHLPNAQLIIYPDSGHGALFQYAGAFTSHVSEFLDRSDALFVEPN
jgi:pimeloyl-ACP methyl ester carboxylesterase